MAVVVKEGRIGAKEATAAGPAERTLSSLYERVSDEVEPPIGTKRYWLGTLDQSPIQNATVGGRSFPRTSYRLSWVDGERSARKFERRGAIEDLTDEQFAAIKKNAAEKFVRKTGRKATVVQPTGNRTRFATDEPLGTYLYCLPIDEAARILGSGWQDSGSPPPLIAPRAK